MTGTTTGPFGGEYTPSPLAQFLGRLVPWSPASYVFIHAWGGDVQPPRRPYSGGGRAFQGLDELNLLQNHVDYLNSIQAEVFFCLSSQTTLKSIDQRGNRRADRKRENAHLIKAFVLDLDVKAKGYPSQRAALAAVLPFLQELGLEPGFIVSSGKGLHVYIVLDQPITPDRWDPLAEALVAAAAAAGLKCDAKVTKNPATLLRLPTSSNRKDPDNPLICSVLGTGRDTTLAEVEAALLPYKSTVPARANGGASKIDLSVLPRRTPITGPEHERVLAEIERNRVVTSIDNLRSVCPVVESSYQRGGDGDRQPLWFELAKLCHYVEDGRDWFHHMSCDDDRYEHAKADKEYTRMVPRGWPQCATIAAASDAALTICQQCPLYNQGQSPINAAVGVVSKLPDQPAAQPYVNGLNGHASTSAFIVEAPLIELPPPYSFNDQRWIIGGDGKPITTTPVLALNLRKKHQFDRHNAVIQLTVPVGDERNSSTTFDFPVGLTSSGEKTQGLLHTHGCIVPNAKTAGTFFMDFTSWIQNNRRARVEERPGWMEDDGNVVGFSFESHDPRMIPRGDLAAWKEAAGTLVGKGLTSIELMIAGAFAAPLVAFTSVDGLVLFAKSSGTGTGKTATLETGASVWMSKKMVFSSGTEMATAGRVAALNNLPVYHDEMVKNASSKQRFTEVIMQVTSGRERIRLDTRSDEKATRDSKTMLIAASNYSLVEAASGGESNAQAARVLEIQMGDASKLGVSLSAEAKIRRVLEANYGTAGRVYADYLHRNWQKVEAAVLAAVDYFQGVVKGGSSDRFWISGAACLYIGAKIAKQLGLLDFDLESIRKTLIEEMQRQRTTVTDLGLDSDDPAQALMVLNQFLNEDLTGIIRTEAWPDHIGKHTKRDEIRVRAEYANRTKQFIARRCNTPHLLVVSESAWRRWCLRRERPIAYSTMRQLLIKHGHCVQQQRVLTAATDLLNKSGQERTLVFDLTLPINAFLVEEKADV